jgi:hypothetical protein
MKEITYQNVKELYLSKGYKFRQQKMALNIGAIRSKESQSDAFDDIGWCAWISGINGTENLFTFKMTTDPGKHWLLSPMSKEGTIIIVPGQYLEVYGEGKHNGEYTCFKQIAPIQYVRDYNKDSKLDFDLYRNPENLKIRGFWGVNGTNLHRASAVKNLLNVGMYSAGCQVLQNVNDFNKLIGLQSTSRVYGFKKWDYSLFEEL